MPLVAPDMSEGASRQSTDTLGSGFTLDRTSTDDSNTALLFDDDVDPPLLQPPPWDRSGIFTMWREAGRRFLRSVRGLPTKRSASPGRVISGPNNPVSHDDYFSQNAHDEERKRSHRRAVSITVFDDATSCWNNLTELGKNTREFPLPPAPTTANPNMTRYFLSEDHPEWIGSCEVDSEGTKFTVTVHVRPPLVPNLNQKAWLGPYIHTAKLSKGVLSSFVNTFPDVIQTMGSKCKRIEQIAIDKDQAEKLWKPLSTCLHSVDGYEKSTTGVRVIHLLAV